MQIRLGYQVLIALIAGIAIGLFLGPLANVFKPIATIYIFLLQMVVLPYICLSIIHGLGSLTPSTAKQLLKKGWPYYLVLWGLIFFIIFLLTTLIPKPAAVLFEPQAATESIKEKLTTNILTFLIPANPVSDFVNNIVPAIAILGMIVGISVMYLEKKEPLLSLVERGDRIIEKILDFLALISPIGVFAHVAVAMGTVQFSQMIEIDLYLAGFIFVTLFIAFVLLPFILSSCTPMSFKESSEAIRIVGLLPFVTGIPTLAIPFINRYLQKIAEKHSFQNLRSTAQTIVPISYSFAQIGNGLLLFFILFSSFYFRHPFTTGEKSLLSFLTIPLSIGSSTTSINTVSFLFTELSFPENALELYTATMPVTMNFQVFLSVAGILTFILLVLFAMEAKIQCCIKRLAYLLGILALFAGAVFAVRPFIHLEDIYHNLYMKRTIREAIPNPVPAQVFASRENRPRMPIEKDRGRVLARILESGVLRVGYEIYDIPYSYLNRNNELVGYDIAMAYQLARDLNCRLEFIPIHLDHIGDDLNQGIYDIAMCAVLMTEKRIKEMSFTDVYSEQNNVLIVPVKKKSQFITLEMVQRKQKDLLIGAMGGYKRVFARNFPEATVYEGDPTTEFGKGKGPADAWIWSKIPAMIWSMAFPEFIVMDYEGQMGKSYLAYPMSLGAPQLLLFMNNWIQLKNLDGFSQEQYDYWILGKPPKKEKEPRWSIIRNVLHWVR
jgi:proton glutamate symport protein